MEFLFGTVHTGNVFEGDISAFSLLEDLGLRLANVEDLSSTSRPAAQSPHQEHPYHHHKAQEDHPRQDLSSPLVGWLVTKFKTMGLLKLLQIPLVIVSPGDVHGGVGSGIKGLQQLGLRLAS